MTANTVYGHRPCMKFKAVEVIACIPYQSWEVAAYTILTGFYGDEARAIKLAKTSSFSRQAQDNETMHVVVITKLPRNLSARGSSVTRLFLLPFSTSDYLASWCRVVLHLN